MPPKGMKAQKQLDRKMYDAVKVTPHTAAAIPPLPEGFTLDQAILSTFPPLSLSLSRLSHPIRLPLPGPRPRLCRLAR